MNIREVGLLANEAAQRICEVLLPNGRHVGKQWVVGDVAGSDGDSMAVELDGPKQGQWYDHAAGIGGDMLKLVELNKGLRGVIAAADEVRKILGMPEWRPDPKRNGHEHPAYDPCTKAWRLKHNQEWTHPTKSWAYTDASGAIVAYVCRIDWSEGGKAKKDVLPQRVGDDGKWHWKGFKGDEKRPLYALHRLTKQDDGRPLLIVEGEKTADAAAKLFPAACVTTWMGGCKNVSKADWSPVTNWKGPLVVWPDNDDEGQSAAIYLCGRFPKARKVLLPDGLPPKWDLADPVPDGVSLHGLFDAAIAAPAKPVLTTAANMPKPYVALGCDEAGYFFLSRTEGFLMHYTTSMFTELGVYRIAPDSFWEGLGFYREKSNKIDYSKAAKMLMGEGQAIGAFEATKVRGRGVYEDADRVVVHLGDRLIVDGIETAIVDHKSEYLYPKRPPIRSLNLKKPLTSAQASDLIALLEKCTWMQKRSAYLLAGFIYCCFMPGILPWRPHFGLTGPSSSGKTWLIGHILYPCIKDFARVFMAVASSEAGVRQSLAIDALACILDEFDAEHGHTIDSLTNMTGLARQSSSDTGGAGVKGTQDGTARTYALKSCFCFVGTALALTMKADQSRVTVAELRKADEKDNSFNFPEIQTLAASTTENASWVESFAGRAMLRVREMLASVTVFRRVASRFLHDTRAGDQNGTLLAGAWMCFNDTPPTEAQAEEFMAGMDWEDLIPTDADTDHAKCLKSFLAFRIDYDDQGHNTKDTVGRLLERAFDQNLTADGVGIARRALEQYGIRIEFDRIFIARQHRGIENIFRGTPYISKWETHFMRLDGAISGALRIHGMRYIGVFLTYRSLLQ